jgi:hypothetical protein
MDQPEADKQNLTPASFVTGIAEQGATGQASVRVTDNAAVF